MSKQQQQTSKANVPSSHTLWSPHDTIKDVADSIGISAHWNDEVAKNLAMDVEYRIHEIIEQATKFMRHSKRRVLTTQDIDRAMKVLNLEPLYGYDSIKPQVFKEAMIGPGQTLYYIEDDEIDFETFINQPLPPVPRYTSCTAHWLAVEGIQPAIPQNPNLNDIKAIPISIRGTLDNFLSLNNDEITLATSKSGVTSIVDANNIKPSNKKDLDIKPLVKHVLSKELQLYFNKCIEILTTENSNSNTNENLKLSVLQSIKIDPGLHQLVPYFIQFIAETITHNLKNLELLNIMVDLIYSLLNNSTLFLDPYIHALMPCILTLLLAKSIGNDPQNHQFKFRDLSMDLLKDIIKKYSNSYNTLTPRITRTLLKALLSNSTRESIGTQYGAIYGLMSLGNEVIRIILIGNIKIWFSSCVSPIENEEDKQILLKKVLECLNLLSEEGKLVKSNKKRSHDDLETSTETIKLTSEMENKLIEKLGAELSEEILKKSNALDIYNGIFLGEI